MAWSRGAHRLWEETNVLEASKRVTHVNWHTRCMIGITGSVAFCYFGFPYDWRIPGDSGEVAYFVGTPSGLPLG